MASEEQYLDDLLKNIIGDEPPKERTMQEAMREIGVDYSAEPDSAIDDPVIDDPVIDNVPEIEPESVVSAIPDITEENSDQTSELSFSDQDVLADMLDILDNPASFSDDNSGVDTSEDEINQMLEEVPEILAEPEEVSEADPLQGDLENMLDGIEENFNAEQLTVEEPVLEEPVAEEPVSDESAAVEEPVLEEPAAEDIPSEETSSQEDLSALLEGIGGDDPNAKMSPDDIAAMFAAAEGAAATEESAAEAPVAEEPVSDESAAVEEPVAEEELLSEAPAEEEIPSEETSSQEDLSALLEGIGGDDPNAKMSPDDIAAMFAAAEGAAATEEPAAEEPVAEEPVSDESAAAEEPALEEPAAEDIPLEETSSQEDLSALLERVGGDDPNAKMSPDDIAAMFAAAEGAAATEEPAAEEPAEEEIPSEESGTMMSSDDELLKMLGEAETAEDFVMPEDRMSNVDSVDADNLSQSDIEALMSGESLNVPDGESQEDLEALLAMAGESEEPPAEASQDDLEAMLAATGDETDTGVSEDMPADSDLSQDDLEAMLGGLDLGDSDSASSSDDLTDVEKLEATEGSDEDLLSLLEGIDETASEESDDEGLPDELSGVINGEETDDNGKKAKKKFSLLSLLPFGKKKKTGEEAEETGADAENVPEGEEPIEAEEEQIDKILDGIEESAEGSGETKSAKEGEQTENPEKKKGFFAKILSFLFDEEPEEEVTLEGDVSNEDILAQIDSENAEEDAKGKKGKKAKKSKKKKGKKEEGEGEGEGSSEESEGDEGDSKKKKKKKEKAPKEPKEPKEKEPRKVVLSKKAFIALVAFCASLIAAIVIISTLLPDHADKVAARRSYFLGDYRAVYDKLHDKSLSDSDYLLYKKAETVLLLQRRVDSYHNRIKLNEPAQALDSLLEGVHLYDILSEEDRYNTKEELSKIYDEILTILSTQYGIDRNEALRIYSIEDPDAYTEELIRIISGGNYIIEKPGAAPDQITDEELAPEDIPDEEPPQEITGESEVEPADEQEINEEMTFEELHPLDDLLEAEEDL